MPQADYARKYKEAPNFKGLPHATYHPFPLAEENNNEKSSLATMQLCPFISNNNTVLSSRILHLLSQPISLLKLMKLIGSYGTPNLLGSYF